MLCVSAWDVPEYASPTFHRELKDKIKRLVAPSKIQASLRAAAKIVGGPDGVVASQDAQRLVEKFFTDVFSHCSDHNTDRTASRVETLKGFDPQTFIFIAFAYQFEEVLALDRHSFAYLAEKTKDLLCSLNLPMRWVFQEPIWEAVSHRKDDDGDDVELFRQSTYLSAFPMLPFHPLLFTCHHPHRIQTQQKTKSLTSSIAHCQTITG